MHDHDWSHHDRVSNSCGLGEIHDRRLDAGDRAVTAGGHRDRDQHQTQEQQPRTILAFNRITHLLTECRKLFDLDQLAATAARTVPNRLDQLIRTCFGLASDSYTAAWGASPSSLSNLTDFPGSRCRLPGKGRGEDATDVNRDDIGSTGMLSIAAVDVVDEARSRLHLGQLP